MAAVIGFATREGIRRICDDAVSRGPVPFRRIVWRYAVSPGSKSRRDTGDWLGTPRPVWTGMRWPHRFGNAALLAVGIYCMRVGFWSLSESGALQAACDAGSPTCIEVNRAGILLAVLIAPLGLLLAGIAGALFMVSARHWRP